MVNKSIKIIVMSSLMASLAIVFDQLSIKMPLFKFTLHPLPLMLAGIMFGPYAGCGAGLVAGVISQFMEYGPSPTMPLWLIAYVLWGAVPSLILKKMHIAGGGYKQNHVLTAVFITSIIVTMVNTVVIWLDAKIMGYPSQLTFLVIICKFFTSGASSFVYVLLMLLLLKRLKEMTFFNSCYHNSCALTLKKRQNKRIIG